MALTLADVCDLDRLVSTSPIAFDLPSTERYARGVDATMRRILGGWADDGQLLELEGRTFGAADLAALRSSYAGIAERVPFVLSVIVRVTLDGALLTISASVKLTDGRTYPLEVTTGEAAAAIAALGAA